MNPSENVKVYNTDLSVMWFDEEGIFCSVTKKGASLDKQALEESFEIIRSGAGGKKICWIGDVTYASPPTKEARDFAGTETPKFIKALALITNSALSRTIANAFMFLKKPPYPTRMFTNEKEARAWLKQYQ